MSIGVLLTPPIVQFFNNAGLVAANGSVLTQVGGINAATYQDVGLTQPLPNPIPLNSRGEVSTQTGVSSQCFLTPNTVYVFTLFDGPNGTGNQLWQATYVNGVQFTLTPANVGSIIYPTSLAESNAGVIPTVFTYKWGDPRRYGPAGTVGTGGNDTTPVQTAFSVGGDVYVDDNLTYLVTAITGTKTVRVVGAGIIRQLSNPGVQMIYYPAGNPNLSFDCGFATYDGNQSSQGSKPSNITVDFRSTGTTSVPTTFRANNANFINGGVADIRIFGVQTGNLVSAFIEGCNFLGGALGDAAGTYFPRSIDIGDGVDILVTGCTFDIEQSPIAAGQTGKAGIVGYFNQSESTPTPGPPFTAWLRPRIIGNSFNRMGRDQANGQGSIDLYGYAVDAVVQGNIIRNFACRGINVKGSDPRAIIMGNQVDTAYPGLTNTVTGIVLNASTTADLYNDVRIQGNEITATTYDAIYVNGQNVNGTGTISGVIIKDNTIRGCASGGTGRDIAIQACMDADIIGNSCYSNGAANSIGAILSAGLIRIQGNRIVSPSGRGILLNDGDNNSAAYLEIDGNTIANPGLNGLGSAMYLGSIGGANIGDANRIYGAQGTPIYIDQSATVTGTISGSVLTVTATNSGIPAPNHLITAPGNAASNVSIPGLATTTFGTYTVASGVGTINLSGSPTPIASPQTFILTGQSVGTLATPRTILLNNNTLGTITVSQRNHLVDTYNAVATGNLFWINGGFPGMELTLKPLTSSRTVVVKDNSGSSANGNIHIGGDFSLSAVTNSIKLILNGSTGFWELISKN